jgi:hypothetical protein
VLRWIARVWSIASFAVIAAFAFGEGGRGPNVRELVALAFFPVGVLVGLAVAWWREGLGGAIAIGSLAGFYLWIMVLGGRPPAGPYFLLLAAPGFLFLIAWFMRRPIVRAVAR